MTHRLGQKQNNQDKLWTKQQVSRLNQLAKGNTPIGLIADVLGRTKDAVRTKASQQNISLKPVNQSPYNRRRVSND